MIDRLMRRLMPVPRGLVVKSGSKIFSANCGGQPSLVGTRITRDHIRAVLAYAAERERRYVITA
jgi:uncharacterized protein (DUF433 family)